MSRDPFEGLTLEVTDEPDWIEQARRDYKDPACPHDQAIVDVDKRTLACKQCGVALDPIAHLSKRAGQLQRRHQEVLTLQKLRDETTTHAIGRDGVLTRCGMNSPRKFTVTVTNLAGRVDCRLCRAKLQTEGLMYSHIDGHEVLL